jgi:hypothetical protein
VPATLYLFYPHGSKNISDLRALEQTRETRKNYVYNLPIILHDQEPLNYDYYQDLDTDEFDQFMPESLTFHSFKNPINSLDLVLAWKNQLSHKNLMAPILLFGCLYEQAILLHSEKNSNDLEKYVQNNFVPVYYWCHAVIARDWYRFAQIDARLQHCPTIQKKFLIYNRSWGNTREYRLKFMELLINKQLHLASETSISKLAEGNSGHHYRDHEFKNTDFALQDIEILNQLQDNIHNSNESARYNPGDFNSTALSVVLETVFDSSKIHLTEKILRPIACGHPFVLAAGPGSLAYVRSYGFQTFAPWIDETYDTVLNPRDRLQLICDELQRINNLAPAEFGQFLQEIRRIADFNKMHFFSDAFAQQVVEELKSNLVQAVESLNRPRGRIWRSLRTQIKKAGIIDVNIAEQSQRRLRWLRSVGRLS